MKKVLIPFLVFLILNNLSMASTWTGSVNSSWSNSGNWSGGVPGSGDNATFNSGSVNCTIDATVNVSGMSISGYTGTISQGSYAITVGSSNFVQTSGTFTGGDASFDLNGQFQLSGGTFTATSGTMYVSQYWTHTSGGTFAHNNGTVEIDRNSNLTIDVNSTETFYNLTLNMGSISNYVNISAGDVLEVLNTLSWTRGYFWPSNSSTSILEVQGNVNFGTSIASGAIQKIKFSGGNDQTLSFSGSVDVFDGPVIINKSGGSVILGTDFTMNNSGQSITLTAGTLNLNGYTLSNTAANTVCDGTFTISGTGTLANYGWTQSSSSAALTISGACTFSIGSGDFTMSAGTFNSGSATFDDNDQFILSGGTFNATSGTMSVANYWTHTGGGTFNHNSGTVIFDGSPTATCNVATSETFYNLTLNKASSSNSVNISTGDVLIIEGTFNWTQGYFYPGGGGSMLQAQGDVNFGTNIAYGANITLKFSGGSDQDMNFSGATDVFDGPVIIDKSGGQLTLNSDFTLDYSSQSLTLSGGTLNLNGNTLSVTNANTTCDGTFTIAGTGILSNLGWTQTSGSADLTISGASTFSIGSGDFTMSAGTFTTGSATFDDNDQFILSGGTFNASSGNMYVANYWTHTAGGTFNHNNGTVILDGSNNPQINVMATETFYNLTLNKSAGNYPNIQGTDILKTIGTLTLTSGFFYTSTGASLEAQGNVVVGSNYGTQRYLTLNFTGSAVQTFDLTGATSSWGGDIIVNKAGGQVNLLSALIVNESNQSLTITAGTFDLNGYNLTAPGSGGSFSVASGGNLQLQGGETISSTPTLNTGCTVTYDGTVGPYTMKNWSYKNLTINGGASSVFSMPANITGMTTVNISQGILYLSGYNFGATTLNNDGTFRLNGTETVTLTNMDVNSGLFEYVGNNSSNTLTTKDFGATDYFNLSINDANVTKATFQPGSALTVGGTLTITGGTFSANSQTSTITGLCTVNGGTYTASSATQTLNGGIAISSGAFTGSSGNVDINGTFTQSGGVFTAPSTNLYVSDNFSQNSGTFTHNSGTVNLDGSSNQTLSCSGTINNLTVNNAAGVTVSSALTISNTLNLTDGLFDIGSNPPISPATITGNGGTAQKVLATLNAPNQQNLGQLGAIVTSAEDLGATTVKVGFTAQSGYGNTGINRYYIITPNNNTGLNATLVFTYNDSELNGKDEADLILFKSTDEGSSWIGVPSTVNTTANTLTIEGLDGFSWWTAGDKDTPLPIKLLNFSAELKNEKVNLNWSTASEQNNDFFTIERLTNDDSEFTPIITIPGAGNSNKTLYYSAIDDNPLQGISYYRLKQTDYDGKFEYSKIIAFDFCKNDLTNLIIYPNPTNGQIELLLNDDKEKVSSIEVYNILGEIVYYSASYQSVIDLSDIPNGTYFLRLNLISKTIIRKIILEK